MSDPKLKERRRRDRGLARVSSVSRWMTVTAAFGAAAFSAMFGLPHLFDRADASTEAPDTSVSDPGIPGPDPGNVAPDPGSESPSTAGAVPATDSGGRTSASTAPRPVPSIANRASSSGGLGPPTQPPVTTRRRPRVVSGAS